MFGLFAFAFCLGFGTLGFGSRATLVIVRESAVFALFAETQYELVTYLVRLGSGQLGAMAISALVAFETLATRKVPTQHVFQVRARFGWGAAGSLLTSIGLAFALAFGLAL